jgi:hypothetical protein
VTDLKYPTVSKSIEAGLKLTFGGVSCSSMYKTSRLSFLAVVSYSERFRISHCGRGEG